MIVRVTVVGSLNMDLVARAPRIPEPGETIIGGEFYSVPGGKGANQAVAAARIGAQVSMVGRVGNDTFAESLLHSLASDRIGHVFVTRDAEAATGVALIVVDDRGQNSIVVASGANMRLSPADVDAAEAALAESDVLLLQLESPLDTVARAAELARAHGVRVILNPAPARPLCAVGTAPFGEGSVCAVGTAPFGGRSVPDALLSLVDVLILNESETALLTGMPVADRAGAEEAAAALRELGVGTVILTLGARGALLARATGVELIPAFEVTPVDTTAAGDAFVAGFAVALAEGKALAEAARWGNAAGALATTKMGAQPSLPTRRAVEQLLTGGAAKGDEA
jgi:ribokinase